MTGPRFAGKVIKRKAGRNFWFVESGPAKLFLHPNDSPDLDFAALRSGDLVEFAVSDRGVRGVRAVDARLLHG